MQMEQAKWEPGVWVRRRKRGKALPKFWMDETSAALRSTVEAYLAGGEITPRQAATMRCYLRRWINAGAWHDDDWMAALRGAIDSLRSRAAIEAWLDAALLTGIDPL